MANNIETLKKYVIDVEVSTQKATAELNKLQKKVDEGVNSGAIKKDTQASVNQIEGMIKGLSASIAKESESIKNSLKNGLSDIKTKELEDKFTAVNQSINSVIDKINLLSTTLNNSDFAKFERFVDAFTVPLQELNKTVTELNTTLTSLADPLRTISNMKVGAIDTKAFEQSINDLKPITEKAKNELKKSLESLSDDLSELLDEEGNFIDFEDLTNEVAGGIKKSITTALDLIKKTRGKYSFNIGDFFTEAGVGFDERTLKDIANRLDKQIVEALPEGKSRAGKKSGISTSTTINLKPTAELTDADIKEFVDQLIAQINTKIQSKVESNVKVKVPIVPDTKGLTAAIKTAISEYNKADNKSAKVDVPISVKIDQEALELAKGKIQESLTNEEGLSIGGGTTNIGDIGGIATEATLGQIRDILASGISVSVGSGTNTVTIQAGKVDLESNNPAMKDYSYYLNHQLKSPNVQETKAWNEAGLEVEKVAVKSFENIERAITKYFTAFAKGSDLSKVKNPLDVLKESPLFTATANNSEYAKYGRGLKINEFQDSLSKTLEDLVNAIQTDVDATKNKFDNLKTSVLTQEAKELAVKELEDQKEYALSTRQVNAYKKQHGDEIRKARAEQKKLDEQELKELEEEYKILTKKESEAEKKLAAAKSKKTLSKYGEELGQVLNRQKVVKSRMDYLSSGSNSSEENVIRKLISQKYNELVQAVQSSSSMTDDIQKYLQSAAERAIANIVNNYIKESDIETKRTTALAQKGKYSSSLNVGANNVINKTLEEEYLKAFYKGISSSKGKSKSDRLSNNDLFKLFTNALDPTASYDAAGKTIKSMATEQDQANAIWQIMKRIDSQSEETTKNYEKQKAVLEKIRELQQDKTKDNTEEINQLKQENELVNRLLEKKEGKKAPTADNALGQLDKMYKGAMADYNKVKRQLALSSFTEISGEKSYQKARKQYVSDMEELSRLSAMSSYGVGFTPYEKSRLDKLQRSVPLLREELTIWEDINNIQDRVTVSSKARYEEEKKVKSVLSEESKFIGLGLSESGNKAYSRIANNKGATDSLITAQVQKESVEELTAETKDYSLVISEMSKNLEQFADLDEKTGKYIINEEKVNKIVTEKTKAEIQERIKALEAEVKARQKYIKEQEKYYKEKGMKWEGRANQENRIKEITESIDFLKNGTGLDNKELTQKRSELKSLLSEIEEYKKKEGFSDKDNHYLDLVERRKKLEESIGYLSKKYENEKGEALSFEQQTRDRILKSTMQEYESLRSIFSEKKRELDLIQEELKVREKIEKIDVEAETRAIKKNNSSLKGRITKEQKAMNPLQNEVDQINEQFKGRIQSAQDALDKANRNLRKAENTIIGEKLSKREPTSKQLSDLEKAKEEVNLAKQQLSLEEELRSKATESLRSQISQHQTKIGLLKKELEQNELRLKQLQKEPKSGSILKEKSPEIIKAEETKKKAEAEYNSKTVEEKILDLEKQLKTATEDERVSIQRRLEDLKQQLVLQENYVEAQKKANELAKETPLAQEQEKKKTEKKAAKAGTIVDANGKLFGNIALNDIATESTLSKILTVISGGKVPTPGVTGESSKGGITVSEDYKALRKQFTDTKNLDILREMFTKFPTETFSQYRLKPNKSETGYGYVSANGKKATDEANAFTIQQMEKWGVNLEQLTQSLKGVNEETERASATSKKDAETKGEESKATDESAKTTSKKTAAEKEVAQAERDRVKALDDEVKKINGKKGVNNRDALFKELFTSNPELFDRYAFHGNVAEGYKAYSKSGKNNYLANQSEYDAETRAIRESWTATFDELFKAISKPAQKYSTEYKNSLSKLLKSDLDEKQKKQVVRAAASNGWVLGKGQNGGEYFKDPRFNKITEEDVKLTNEYLTAKNKLNSTILETARAEGEAIKAGKDKAKVLTEEEQKEREVQQAENARLKTLQQQVEKINSYKTVAAKNKNFQKLSAENPDFFDLYALHGDTTNGYKAVSKTGKKGYLAHQEEYDAETEAIRKTWQVAVEASNAIQQAEAAEGKAAEESAEKVVQAETKKQNAKKGKTKGMSVDDMVNATVTKIQPNPDDYKATEKWAEAEALILMHGEEMAQKFIRGLKGRSKDEKEAMAEFAEVGVDAVKEALGIHSPSEVFEYLGEMCGEGFKDGILNSLEDLKKVLVTALQQGVVSKDDINELAGWNGKDSSRKSMFGDLRKKDNKQQLLNLNAAANDVSASIAVGAIKETAKEQEKYNNAVDRTNEKIRAWFRDLQRIKDGIQNSNITDPKALSNLFDSANNIENQLFKIKDKVASNDELDRINELFIRFNSQIKNAESEANKLAKEEAKAADEAQRQLKTEEELLQLMVDIRYNGESKNKTEQLLAEEKKRKAEIDQQNLSLLEQEAEYEKIRAQSKAIGEQQEKDANLLHDWLEAKDAYYGNNQGVSYRRINLYSEKEAKADNEKAIRDYNLELDEQLAKREEIYKAAERQNKIDQENYNLLHDWLAAKDAHYGNNQGVSYGKIDIYSKQAAEADELVALKKELLELDEKETYYTETRNKLIAEGKRQQEEYNNSIKELSSAQGLLDKMSSQAFLSDKIDLFRNKLDDLKVKWENALSGYKGTEKQRQELQSLIDQIEILNKESVKYKETMGNLSFVDINAGNIDDIEKLKDAMTQLAEQRGYSSVRFKRYTKDQKDLTMVCRDEKDQLIELRGAINQTNNSLYAGQPIVKQNISFWKSYGDTLKRAFSTFGYYLGFAALVRKTMQEFRQGISTLKEFDSALTTISYTMDLSQKELRDLGLSAVEMAEDLSMSMENALKVYQIYANMQTTAEEIEKVARPTAILSNLSGVDASTAADQVQGILQQFNMLKKGEEDIAETSMHVVDVLDKISANVAIDYSKGIGIISEAVTATGQVAHDAGMSFEELAAITAKVAERTREDGSTIGNAMKTMFVRISKVSKMPQYADEVDNEQISKAAKALHDIGIEVYKSNGEFNNITETLTQLNDKWDSLNDVQKSNIAFQVAATRQSAKFKSMLEAWTGAMDLANDAVNANGNALANQEKYEESYAGKLQKLETQWKEFWLNLLNSDGFKDLLDAIIDLVKWLDKLGDEVGHVKVVVGGLALTSILGTIIKLGSQYALNAAAIRQIGKAAGVSAAEVGTLVGEMQALNVASNSAGVSGVKGVTKAAAGATAKTAAIAAPIEVGDTLAMMSAYQLGLEGVEEGAKNAGKSTSAFFNTSKNGNGIVGKLATSLGLSTGAFVGIAAAIAAASYAIYKFATAQSEMNERIKEASDEYSDQASSIEEYRKKAVELNSIANDNTKSLEEQQEARKNLLALQADMIEQFGDEASKIDFLTESVNGLNASFDRLNEHSYQEFLNKANDNSWDSDGFLWGVFNGDNYSKLISSLGDKSNVDKLKEQYEKAGISQLTIDNNKAANKLLVEELKKQGLNADLGIEELDTGWTYSYIKGTNNLKSYYDGLLEIQEKYRDKTDVNSKLIYQSVEAEAKRVNKLLYDEEEGISDSYNTILEHDVINKSYSQYVTKINKLKEDLKKAQIDNNEEEVSKISGQLVDAYNEVIKRANGNESIKQWFDNFVSDVQLQMNEHEFIAKIKPELDTEDSRAFKEIQDIINNGGKHMYDDEIISVAQQDDAYDSKAMQPIEYTYGRDFAKVIEYIRKTAAENEIPISVVVDQFEIPNKARKDLEDHIKKLGHSISELSEQDINTLMTIDGATLMSWQQLQQAIYETNAVLNQPKTRGGMIDSITDLTDGFDKLDEIYADIYDKGSFDFTKLASKKFEESFADLGEEYEEFIETVSANTEDLDASQEAFNKLAWAYIESTNALSGLTEENKNVAISMLQTMGIENAEEVVLNELARQQESLAGEKEFVTKYTKQLSSATVDEINELIQEKGYSEQTSNSLKALALEKMTVNGNVLDFTGDLNNLINFIEGVDGATSALRLLNQVRNGEAGIISNERKKNIETAAQKEYQAAIDKLKNKANTQVKYTGGDKTRDAKDKANKSAEDTKKIYDWIEKAIQRQEEEISRLDKTVTATYKDWSKRNTSLLSEINEITKEISMQQSAYQAYLRDAEAIPLSEEYKKLVREGAMRSELISDKTLQKNIDEYEELYDKAIKAKDAIEDLNAKIAALAKSKFDNVKSEFEGFTSEIEHFVGLIDKQLSHVENMNKIAGKSFYNAKMEQNTEKINDLYREREALMQALREAEANGIEAGSADWISMRNDIYAVDEAIADLTYELEDLKKKLQEVAKLNFDNLKEQFENVLSIIQNQTGLTDAVVSMVETSGHMASRAYYESLIEGSKATVTGLRKQYETLTKTLEEAVASGDIKEYSEEWYAMQNDIASVKNELIDAANATIEYVNALRQINWDVFDRGVSTIGKLIDETEFFIELLSYDDLFNKDTGEWTDEGITTRGLMVEEYQAYKDQAEAYGKEAEEIRKLLETDPKNTTLIDRYYELLEAQRQAILNSKKEKKAVQDLYKEAYDNLLKRIKELIDKYKEALQATKDLYDYENTIEEKTKNINDIRKQLLAYGSGYDTSEENRATIQKLNTDLDAAQKDLEQTEYDKYIQDQQNLLDQFYNELQEWIDGRLDNIEALFAEAVEATNLNGLLIDNTLHENADAVNYQMTEEFMSIWDKYADGEGYAALSYDILGLTNDVTNGIRDKMEELPTDANLSQYFDGVDLAILEQIASEENNANNMTNAINMTNEGINRISSNIVELSNTLGSKIDYAGSSVANAINSLDFSTGSSGYDAPGGGNYDGGGGGGGGSTNPSNNNPSSPGRASNGNQYTVYQTRSTNGQSMNEQKGTFSTAGEANAYKRKLESTYRNTGASFVVRMYAKGGLVGKNKNILDSIAQLFGEDHMIAAKEGERVLTEDQTKNFEKMVNANFTPLDADAKDKYSMLSGLAGKDISSSLANIPTPEIGNLTNVGNTTTVGDVSITLPNVTNKEEFVEWLKNDGQIERIIQSMTIGRLSGGNSYAKLRF